MVVTADLRASRVTCHVDVDAPRDGRPTTRVNWLLRQLKTAPDTARIEAFVAHSRGSAAAELLSTVRKTPASLVVDPSKELRTFRIATTGILGTKRGRGRGSFIDSVLNVVDSFYGDVLGSLRAWSAAPPKLRLRIQNQPKSTSPSRRWSPQTTRLKTVRSQLQLHAVPLWIRVPAWSRVHEAIAGSAAGGGVVLGRRGL